MKIGLSMIVRDERTTLERCLDSVFFQDVRYAYILDTGSTDGTLELLEGLKAKFKDVQFVWGRGEFIDFAQARNLALEGLRANFEVDYALIMDADHTFSGDRWALAEDARCGADVVMIKHRYAGIHYQKPVLLRLRPDLHWQSPIHEYPVYDEQRWPITKVIAARSSVIVHTDGFRSRINGQEKFRRDAQMALNDWVVNNRPRSLFYAAQSFRDAGDQGEALKYYRQRASMWNGWEEERWYADYQALRIQLDHAKIYDDAMAKEIMRIWSARPWRAEPLVYGADWARRVQHFHLSLMLGTMAMQLPDGGARDVLFVDYDCRQLFLWDTLMVSAWHAKVHEAGREAADRVERWLKYNTVPPTTADRLVNNLRFYR